MGAVETWAGTETTAGARGGRGTAIGAEVARLERRGLGRQRLRAELRHGRLVLLLAGGDVVHRAPARASPAAAVGDDP